jgi:hypothetical protein
MEMSNKISTDDSSWLDRVAVRRCVFCVVGVHCPLTGMPWARNIHNQLTLLTQLSRLCENHIQLQLAQIRE